MVGRGESKWCLHLLGLNVQLLFECQQKVAFVESGRFEFALDFVEFGLHLLSFLFEFGDVRLGITAGFGHVDRRERDADECVVETPLVHVPEDGDCIRFRPGKHLVGLYFFGLVECLLDFLCVALADEDVE